MNITEQELFSSDIEYSNDFNYKHSKEAREILDLLKFAPKGAVENGKSYLLKYKGIFNGGVE